ncbi:MAG TPA: hypothetical protein VMQ45_01870 [Burkholderiaceae bacterium]|nr:hypothetical protein [Burkholderiaceae bacterium]
MNLKNTNHRFSVDDALFVMALSVPAIVAAACYLESERQMSALEPGAQTVVSTFWRPPARTAS